MLSPGSITNSVPDSDKAVRLQRDIQRTAQENASARSLQQSQIGAGGLLVNNGGSITVTGGGTITLPTGTLSAANVTATAAVSAGTTIAAGGAITGASVAVTGATSSATATTSGVATIGGLLTADAGMSSLDARNTTVITGRAAIWADVGGRFGNSSSSVLVKQDFAPADLPPKVDAILRLALLEYRRIDAVQEFGDKAPVELGSIVEYVAGTPLHDATFSDAEGRPQGINWSEMVPALIATVQALNARIVVLEHPPV